MSILNRAKSHFESLGVQSLEVEEWPDDSGKATIIYWNPITLAEKKRLFERSSNINDVGLLADIVIMKALDKDGNKIFKSTKGLNVLKTKNMKEAVEFAYKNTAKGEICLLSTASTSYTNWKNFEEKGGEFQKFVKTLSNLFCFTSHAK